MYAKDNIDNDEYDLGKFVRTILMQSKLIVGIFVLFTILTVTNYIISEKEYRIESVIKIDSNLRSGLDGANFDIFGASGSSNSINNLLLLYDTRSNMRQLIMDLNLNIYFHEESNKISRSNFKFRSKANTSYNPDSLKTADYKIVLSESFYTIYDLNDQELIPAYPYDVDFENDRFFANVKKPIEIPTKPIVFTAYEVDYLITLYQELVDVSAITSNPNPYFTSDEGLLKVTYIAPDIEEGVNILAYLNNLFLYNDLSFQVQKAKNANIFIDSRLEVIEKDLKDKKNQLREFQESNSSVNIDLEVQSILTNISEIQGQLDSIEVQKAEFKNLYTIENPLFKNLLEQEKILIEQKRNIEQKIKKLPYSQQNYLDLFREFESTQTIFNELINQRLNFSILEASTISNIRVIDEPYVAAKVSPLIAVHFMYILIGFFVAIFIGLVRGTFFSSITNPAELKEHSINNSITAVLPYIDEDDYERYTKSMESFVLNLDSLAKSNSSSRNILITSPTASCGKTTTSVNLAKILAKLGKRVLLIDMDLKKGNVHEQLLIKNRPSQKDFQNLASDNMEKYRVSENLYCFSKLKNISDSFSLLSTDVYVNTISKLKEDFDYIITDSAPILSVADTGLLIDAADVKLAVCRHAQTRINEIKQLNAIFDQLGYEVDGIIYNCYQKPQSYYGYYSLYGNYDYQYYAEKYLNQGYDYEDK